MIKICLCEEPCDEAISKSPEKREIATPGEAGLAMTFFYTFKLETVTPTLSVVILNYKTPGLTKYCVLGIDRARPSMPYEIIVVDNASHDESIPYLRESFAGRDHVRVIAAEENRGYAAGNNIGIAAARGEYILILNPDILVLPNAIERLIQAYVAHPNAAVVGPQLLNPDRSIQFSCYRFPRPTVPVYRRTVLGKLPFARETLDWYLMKEWHHAEPKAVDWILGACLLFRRSMIEALGTFDERFFLYFEDVDWCRRAAAIGAPVVYWPHAQMIHYHQRQSAGNAFVSLLTNRATRAHVASGLKYFWKHRATARAAPSPSL